MPFLKLNSRGFTLIELLVVIAIIGLLSSVVLSSLNGARSKGSDASKKLALQQVKNALALYATDNSGGYPLSTSTLITNKYISSINPSVNYYPKQADGITACTTEPCSSYGLGVIMSDGGVIGGTQEWSGEMGSMNWSSAVTACSNWGGRLPTDTEITSALTAQFATTPTAQYGLARDSYYMTSYICASWYGTPYGVRWYGYSTGQFCAATSANALVRCVK